VPFSRLTLTAQLEVLSRPAGESWQACLPYNPRLRAWRELAAQGVLPIVPWPKAAADAVSPARYGRRFWRLVAEAARLPAASAGAPLRTQSAFVRERLSADHLHPILWSPET
jgi:hypothetical protein